MQSGETLSGYVKNIGRQQRAEYLVFKKTLNGSEQRYTTKEVKRYRIGKQQYEAGSVRFSGMEGYITLFLKKLVEGEVELFRLD